MGNFNFRELERHEYTKWDEFVDNSPQGCIFVKSFWLDALNEKYIILACFDKGDRLLAGMPIVSSREGYITMPKLTQTLGIVFADFSAMKYVKRISKEKDIIMEFVENIPKFKCFDYQFHYNFTNWMPFMWRGYNQHTKYTYVIDDIKDIEKVRSEFSDNTKTVINKALKNNVKIVHDLTLQDMYNMLTKTYERQKMNVPFTFEWFERFDDKLNENNARKIFFAVDEENNLHGALYLVFDKNTAYYLLGGGDPEFRNSGAMYLNVFEGIKYASIVSDKFDFEGSVVPQIETMFRSFGAKQKQYFRISKNNSIISNLKQDIRKYGKMILKRG